MSNLEHSVNQLVIYILSVQALLCVVMSLGSMYWLSDSKYDDFMLEEELSNTTRSLLNFFTYFLLLSTVLPISLPVSLEMTKLV